MSENIEIEKEKYLIAKGLHWRVWNNGIIEKRNDGRWFPKNYGSTYIYEFLSLWKKCLIGRHYECNWDPPQIIPGVSIKYLGFKDQTEICSSCNVVLQWENEFLSCIECNNTYGYNPDYT